MIHIGIFIDAYKNKTCYTKFNIGYAGFFGVRKEIAKLAEFEYGYKNCRTNFNKLKNLITTTYIQDCYIK